MLGLARRAGKLPMGHDMVIDAVKKRKAKLIVFASDISPRLADEVSRATDSFLPAVPCVSIEETMNEIHFSLGYRAGVMAVNDMNFANRIIELLNQEENEYGG